VVESTAPSLAPPLAACQEVFSPLRPRPRELPGRTIPKRVVVGGAGAHLLYNTLKLLRAPDKTTAEQSRDRRSGFSARRAASLQARLGFVRCSYVAKRNRNSQTDHARGQHLPRPGSTLARRGVRTRHARGETAPTGIGPVDDLRWTPSATRVAGSDRARREFVNIDWARCARGFSPARRGTAPRWSPGFRWRAVESRVVV